MRERLATSSEGRTALVTEPSPHSESEHPTRNTSCQSQPLRRIGESDRQTRPPLLTRQRWPPAAVPACVVAGRSAQRVILDWIFGDRQDGLTIIQVRLSFTELRVNCGEQFFPHDSNFTRSDNAKTNPVASNFQNSDFDVTIDADGFVLLAGEDEHDGFLP